MYVEIMSFTFIEAKFNRKGFKPQDQEKRIKVHSAKCVF